MRALTDTLVTMQTLMALLFVVQQMMQRQMFKLSLNMVQTSGPLYTFHVKDVIYYALLGIW